jgi:hypothetical protein
MNAQVDEAERVREEYRGWPVADVLELKKTVESLEQTSGWRLVTADEDEEDSDGIGVALTLSYKKELRLFFYPGAFLASSTKRRRSNRKSKSTSGPNAPLSLKYSLRDEYDEEMSDEPPTEKRFFQQFIRSQIHGFKMMPRGSVSPKTILDTISQGWDLACRVSEELRLLKMAGVTSVQIRGDEQLALCTKLVLPQQSRIDVEFAVSVRPLADGGIETAAAVSAKSIYGARSSILRGTRCAKVEEALTKEVLGREVGKGAFIGAVHAFEQWLSSQASRRADKQAPVRVQEATVPNEPASVAPEPQLHEAGPQPRLNSDPELDALPPATTKEIRRSPLAQKTANIPAKPTAKKLPVPSKRFTLANKGQLPPTVPEPEKENAAVIVHKQVQQAQTPTKQLQLEAEMYTNAAGMDFEAAKPAIPPEMQEQMMAGSPFRRRGALRRTP